MLFLFGKVFAVRYVLQDRLKQIGMRDERALRCWPTRREYANYNRISQKWKKNEALRRQA